MNYLYDGSYEGFLTCVYRHYYEERADGVFTTGDYQLDLLRYAATVETDERLAARVLDAITYKISKWDADRVYRVFCSNEPEKEMKLIRYLEMAFKRGPKIRLLHGNPIVKDVEAAEQRLGREVHRLTGLVRFSELEGGILYSPIEPDNDVLEFLAPHFSDRYRYDPFIIHDKGRGKALFSYNKKWRIEAFEGEMLSPSKGEYGTPAAAGYCQYPDDGSGNIMDGLPQNSSVAEGSIAYNNTDGRPLRVSDSEENIRRLWKQYFGVMATKERVNPKLQRAFVPVRYRKHLPEFDDHPQ